MLDTRHLLHLQAFAEGFDSAGDGGGEGSNDNSGLANQTPDTDHEEDLFGYSDEPEDQTSETPKETNDDDDYQAFREKYKDRIGEDIQSAIQKRFKNQESYQNDYNNLVEGLAPLFYKYGIDESNVKGLLEALSNDDSLYEDMAYEKGLTLDAAKEQMLNQQEISRMRREIEAYENEKMEQEAKKAAYETYNKWVAEADALKELYPSFDLAKELENEDFRNDLVAGKPLQKVYEAAHLSEILQGAIQAAYGKGQEVYANNIKKRGMRPSENGTSTLPVNVKKRASDLTDKDIEAILRRVQRGDVISFD